MSRFFMVLVPSLVVFSHVFSEDLVARGERGDSRHEGGERHNFNESNFRRDEGHDANFRREGVENRGGNWNHNNPVIVPEENPVIVPYYQQQDPNQQGN